jgi:hypothetical protein
MTVKKIKGEVVAVKPQPIGVNLINIVLKRVAQDHSKEYKDH